MNYRQRSFSFVVDRKNANRNDLLSMMTPVITNFVSSRTVLYVACNLRVVLDIHIYFCLNWDTSNNCTICFADLDQGVDSRLLPRLIRYYFNFILNEKVCFYCFIANIWNDTSCFR